MEKSLSSPKKIAMNWCIPHFQTRPARSEIKFYHCWLDPLKYSIRSPWYSHKRSRNIPLCKLSWLSISQKIFQWYAHYIFYYCWLNPIKNSWLNPRNCYLNIPFYLSKKWGWIKTCYETYDYYVFSGIIIFKTIYVGFIYYKIVG